MNLIVGATGILGSQVCSLLRKQDKPVRALVRETSNPDRLALLRSSGAELAYGDLKNRASLDEACRGVASVVTTASSTLSRQSGDSIETVDRQGQLDLIEAAESAGVKTFIYVSVPDLGFECPLFSAKRAVEDRLKKSRMVYTILQPTFFAEVWLSPALGFDVANGTAQIYGSGDAKQSWIAVVDVARFVVAALNNPNAANAVMELGGPEALSALEVVRMAEEITGKALAVQHVPKEILQAQYDAATDGMGKSFAALMLAAAKDYIIDMTDTLSRFPLAPLKTVREYLEGVGRA